jgi:predicted anti-sigma-YlaC factor YlaD
MTMLDCGKIGERLSGYLDGELTQGDRQRVELHLDSCAQCRAALQEMARLRQAVSQLPFDAMSQDDWSQIMSDVSVRTSRGAGWFLYIVGALILVGYAGYSLAVDETVDALVKTGIAAVVLGLTLLFISVLRERLLSRKSDRYEDVQI